MPGRIEPHVLTNHDSVHCVVNEYLVPTLINIGLAVDCLHYTQVWGTLSTVRECVWTGPH